MKKRPQYWSRETCPLVLRTFKDKLAALDEVTPETVKTNAQVHHERVKIKRAICVHAHSCSFIRTTTRP